MTTPKWLSNILRPLYGLILRRPALVLAVGGLFALLWGLVLDDYDAFHTFWSERAWAGIATGVGVALNLAAVCAVARWLDARSGKPEGSYFALWILLVVVAGLPALFLGNQFRTPVPTESEAVVSEQVRQNIAAARLYLPIGLLIVLLAGGVSRFIRLRQRRVSARRGTGTVASIEVSLLPFVGGWAAGLLALGYVVMCFIHGFSPDFYFDYIPAPVAFMFFLGLYIAAVALISRYLDKWIYVLPLLLVIFLAVFAGWLEPEHQLPGLDYTKRMPLKDYEKQYVIGKSTELLDEEVVLNRWQTQIAKLHQPEGSDPSEIPDAQPIIIVTVSGGASTSALYVAQALLNLEAHYPGITRHIRIICGASGGMLGAAYYVSQYRRGGLIRQDETFAAYAKALQAWQTKKLSDADFKTAKDTHFANVEALRQRFVGGLEADFLSPIVQKWAHKDLPLAFSRKGTSNDRAWALEAAWNRHLRGAPVPVPGDPTKFQWDDNHGALDVPFSELRTEEAKGELPSLVFTPMMVEDGRQLIISNLNLHYMPGWASFKDAPQKAYSAIEFFRLFPESASQFKLGTAVRLNASFPFFSPAADLPTEPRRRVVDAGYYDNYGLVVASRWIEKHSRPEGWLTRTKTPVWVLQLWAYGYDERSQNLDQPNDAERQWSVTTPLSGLFSSWRANMAYRGEERLNVIMEELNRNVDDREAATRMRRDIGVQHLPMNWELTSYNRAVIERESKDFDRLAEFKRLGGLATAPGPQNPQVQATTDILQSLPVPNAAQLKPKEMDRKPPEPKKE